MNIRSLSLLLVCVATLGAQGTITSIAPSSVISGVPSFLMAVNGSGFASSNVVQWDGANLATTFVSSTQLAVTVTASLVASAGTHSVRVRVTSTLNVFSNTVTFTVNNPVPTITAVSPGSTPFGLGPVTIDFTGTNFRAQSIVKLGNLNLPTTFLSTTHIQGVLSAGLAALPGTFATSVFNPPPGGGTASFGTFTVLNQVPTLGSISPISVAAGSGGMTLTANGSNYNASSVVHIDGSPLTTTLVSAAQVTAAVPAALVASGASHTITVVNPGTGGGTSASRPFNVNNPQPGMGGVSPAAITTTTGDTTIVVSGFNFVTASVILLDGVAIPTAFVDGTHVSGIVHGATVPVGGTHAITVFNPAPAGGTSSVQILIVNNAVPTLAQISPAARSAGSPGFTLTATGTGYNASSTILWDGSPLATSLISETQLSASIAAALVATAVDHTIAVSTPTPGGGTSGGLILSVTNPVPVLVLIFPATVPSGSSFTLQTVGSGCCFATTIQLDATTLATTLIDSNHVTAIVPAALIAAGGLHAITLNNPIPGGGTSSAFTLTVQNPAPALGNLSPSTVLVGIPTTLTVTGSGFNPASVVRLGGAPLTTTFVSASQVTAVFTAIATGTAAVDVSNPAPGGGISATTPLAMNNPVPVVSSLSPASTIVNGGPPPFSVNGSGFAVGSQVLFDGNALPTAYSGSTLLGATVPAGAMSVAAVHQVSVLAPGPGGGTSNSVPYTVGNPVAVISSISPAALSVGTGGTAPATVALSGSGFLPSSTADVVGQGPMSSTFISPSGINVSLPAALLVSPTQLQIRITNPGPGGGITLAPLLPVFNAIPVVASAAPVSAPFIATNGGSILVTGTGFQALSEVRIDTFPVSASFSGAFGTGSLTAAVPANFLSAGTHQLTVFNPGNGGGESAPVPVVSENPAPLIFSLSTFQIPGGGSDAFVTMTGVNFMFSTTVDASGTGLGIFSQSSSQLIFSFPESLQRAVRSFTITVTNPGPGGGSDAIPFFTVVGPFISSCTPAVIPVLTGGSSPITFTVNGGTFQAGDQIRINGAPQPTTLVNALTLSCPLDGSFPVLLQPGGFAVTVTRQGSFSFVASNAFGVPVGIPGTPDNAGTVTLAPAPPIPGQGFNLRVELPVANVPVTLLAEVPAPTAVMLSIAPGFDLVLGPGLNSPIILADGLGLFGPPTPGFAAPYDLAPFGIPAGHGVFEIRDLGAPPVQIGITFSLAAIYVDPTSPIGLNATHVGGPYSL